MSLWRKCIQGISILILLVKRPIIWVQSMTQGPQGLYLVS